MPRDPRLLKTPHNSRYFRDKAFPIREVALASAAAPTYFPAVETLENGFFIDGGVYANNPVMDGLDREVIFHFLGNLLDLSELDVEVPEYEV